MRVEHATRLNAWSAFGPESLALLTSEDEHEAFENFLELRARCIRDLGSSLEPSLVSSFSPDKLGLLGTLSLIRQRPGMYFGSSRIEYVWALINGYIDGENDHGVSSADTAKVKQFQAWVDVRYPFGRGHPWFRVFRLLAIDDTRGIQRFFEDFDLFLAGDPPDSPDPTMTKMFGAILELSKK